MEERERLEGSLAEFVRGGWHVLEPGAELVWNWHLDTLCAYLEALFRKEIPPFLIINIPPGTMKSLIVAVFYPAWCWIHEPPQRFLTGSNDEKLASRDSLRHRQLVESNWYQSKWGMQMVEGAKVDRVRVSKEQAEKTLWQNTQRGHRECQSVTGQITGKRGDCLAAGTMVETEIGRIAIEQLCAMAHPPRVWSMTPSGLLELQPVVNSRRLWAEDLVEVSTRYGERVVCTRDHRIWTGEGYEKAESVGGRYLSILQRAYNPQEWAAYTMQPVRSHRPRLRDLWREVRASSCRTHEIDQTRSEGGPVLQQGLQSSSPQSVSDHSGLCDVRGGLSAAIYQRVQAPLFQGLRRRVGQGALAVLRAVWRRISWWQQPAEVLFAFLRRQGSIREDAGARQSSLRHDGYAGWSIPADEAVDPRKGWRSMFGLFGPTRCASPGGAPHRRQLQELRSGEPDHPVQYVPHQAPQVLRSRASVRELGDAGGGAVPVYDIQVANNHNFFAGSILVHNCIIWDDPHDAVKTETPERRMAVLDAWDGGWSSRLNDVASSARILVMQRLHYLDCTAHWKKIYPEAIHLIIPMRYEGEPTFDAGKDLGKPEFNDPRTEAGELLFPSKFPEKAVRLQEGIFGPYRAAGQYQQRPSPKGGGEFVREDLMHWKMPPRGGNRYIIVDPAGEKKKTNLNEKRDNSAMIVVECAADQNFYVIDAYRDRLNLTQRADILFQWHRHYRPLGVGYEGDGFESDGAHIRDRMERENYRFKLTELRSHGLKKEDRIRKLLPLFNEHRIYLPERLMRTNFEGVVVDLVEQFIEQEYLPFPVGSFVDMMDVLSRITDPEMKIAFPKPQGAFRGHRAPTMTDPGAGY